MPHYIVIGDGNGHSARFLAKTLIRMTCVRADCSIRIWCDWKEGADPTRFGAPQICYACGSELECEWGEGQLVFVPEGATDIEKLATGDLVQVQYRPTEDVQPLALPAAPDAPDDGSGDADP